MLLDLIGWRVSLIIVITLLLILWLLFGGDRTREVVGIRPLLAPGRSGTSILRDLFDGGGYTDIPYKNPVEDPSEESDMTSEIPPEDPPIPSGAPTEIPRYPERYNIPPYPGQSSDPEPSGGRKISVGEQVTGEAFEALLGRAVQRQVRPDFLKNPATGRNLEMDLYDPVENICVEYDGYQHFHYPNSFMRTEEEFRAQVERDRLKVELCDRVGVYLISVPYWVDMCTGWESSGGVSGETLDSNPNMRCAKSVARATRYRRIYAYLKARLDEYYFACSQMR